MNVSSSSYKIMVPDLALGQWTRDGSRTLTHRVRWPSRVNWSNGKHTRSSLWCYNLWNIRQDRKIIHISYQKTTTSLQRQKKNREWNGSSQNLKRFCAKTCPAKQEVTLRRAPTMMLCRDLPGIKPTPNQLFGDLCVNLHARWQSSMSLESLSRKPI